MFSLNRAQIIGNLTRDPETRYTTSGQSVTSFSIATNRSWQNSDGVKQDAVDYHDIVAWGKLGEIASQILKKGKPAYVEGRLQTRSWDAQDGSKRQKTEIVAENLIALGAKVERDDQSEAPVESLAEDEKPKTGGKKTDKAGAEAQADEIDIDDIPF